MKKRASILAAENGVMICYTMCYKRQKKTVEVSFPSPEGSFKRCASGPNSILNSHIFLTIFASKKNPGFCLGGLLWGDKKNFEKNFEIFARS
jgi:hypothetical protein